MPDYQKLYVHLFQTLTKSIEVLERQDFGTARELLIQGQQEAEELYLDMED